MNLIVCGRRHEGKSTLSLHLARQTHGRAVVVFDPRGIFEGLRCADSGELEAAIREGLFERELLTFTPEGTVEEGFDDLCTVLFPPRFTRTNFALVIDEAGQLQTSHSSRPSLARAVAQHPLHSISIIQNTHRLPELHGKSKSLMDDLFLFWATHPGDLEGILEYTGEPELVETVSRLPLHHCVHYSYRRTAEGQQWKTLDKPEEWYHPIGQQGIVHA